MVSSTAEPLQDLAIFFRTDRPVECFKHMTAGCSTDPCCQFVLLQQADNGVGECIGVARWHDPAGLCMRDDIMDGRHIADNDRQATPHRLDRHQSQPFLVAVGSDTERQHGKVCALIKCRHLCRSLPAQEVDRRADAQLISQWFKSC